MRAKATSAKQRARERIAAERAARKRAEARRRLLAAAGAVTAVLAIVAVLVVVKLTASPAHRAASESAAPAALARQVTTVPAATLAQMSAGQATTLQAVRTHGPLLMFGGKPAIVFVSEESCPFCAAERWALTVALSHFGTWSQLGITKSSATDVYPNTATLSFRSARYRSAELTLSTTELTDNVGHPLQPQTQLDASLIASYDVPPYVNSVDQSGAVPFLDIGNRFILAGAQYDPQVLAGLSAAQIAGQLSNPSSPVAQAVDGSAKVIIAAIDQVLQANTGRG